MTRPFTCRCESCNATDRPLVWDVFLAAAVCVACRIERPRVTRVPFTIPAKVKAMFTGKMYAQ